MAENDIAIQVGVVLNTKDIGEQLANIKTDKNNSIKITANLEDVKKKVREYKESLGKESNAAKILINVLKGESDRKIKEYIDGIHERYVKSPIKITLDVDTQGTTANINKAVGEMQQQVQKAVDQAVKVAGSASGSPITVTTNSSLSMPNASGDTKYWNELNEAVQRYSSAFDDVSAKATKWHISEDMEGNARAAIEFKNSVGEITTAIFKLQDVLDAENKPILDSNGNAIKEWAVVGESYTKSFQAAEQAARKMYEELNRGYKESEKQTEQQYQMYDKMFAKIEQGAQKTSDYLSKQEAEFNKLYSSAFEQKNPLTGEYADRALSALQEYQDKYMEISRSGSQMTAEQKREVEELGKAAALAIQEQQAAQDRYNKSVEEQKRVISSIQEELNKIGKIENQAFGGTNALTGDFRKKAEEEIEAVKSKFAEIKKVAEESFEGAASVSKEQLKKITADFAAQIDALQKRQYPSDKIAAVDVDTKKTSLINELNEQEEKLKRLNQTSSEYANRLSQIREKVSALGKVDSDVDAWAKLRNEFNLLEQDIKKLESSSQGKGIMAAFDISEDQLTRIKSLGDALKGHENTQGVDILRQRLFELKMDYEDLQDKMRSGDLSADMLKGLEVERSALDKELQSINNMVSNLGNESWVNSQNAGIADMKAKFAEYREEITKTVRLTPELDQRLRDLAQAMSESGKVDVTNWKDYSNEIKTLKANIEEFKNSLQGKASQLSLGIEANQIEQINDVVNKLNSLDEQYSGAGVDRIKSDFQSLSEEYQKIIDQLQSKDLTEGQFKELSKQADELDQKLRQLVKEAGTFGSQNSFEKFTASANTLKLNLERLESQYSALIAKNPEFAGRVDELRQKLESLRPGEIPTISKEISNLGKEMANASGQTAGLRGALTDAFGGLGSYLARFTSSYYIITKTIQGIKKMVNAVKEVDTSLVELQKVTNLTGDSLAQFTDKAYKMGAQLGRTGKDVIDAATTFSRAGYSLNEATQLAQSALVMTNVGVDIPNMESAASDMISILKAFDVQAEESMGIIDKLYNVANKEPLDFGNITQMLVTAGGTLAQSGSSLEETMGLLTGAFATMRSPAVANG